MVRKVARSYNRFVVLSLISFQAVSLALLLGWIFVTLTRSYAQEFQQSLDAEAAQIRLRLQDRLNLAMDRLRSCSTDNALRVSLMLGVPQQIDEHIRKYHLQKDGIHILVRDAETGRVYGTPPDIDLEGGHLSREQVLSLFALGQKIFPYFASNSCLFVATSPIQRKDELLGTALLIYVIQGDPAFRDGYGPGSAYALGFWRGTDFVDVMSGYNIPGTFIKREERRSLPFLNFKRNTAQYITIPLGETGHGLHVAFSLDPLSKRSMDLLRAFVLLYLFVLGATGLVGFAIYRRIDRPLQALVQHTEKLARSPSPEFIEEETIPFLEFRIFAASFNKMLSSFLELQRRFAERAREKLQASEERYRKLVETLPMGIVTLDADNRFVFANPAALSFLGYELDRLQELTLNQVLAFKPSEPRGAGFGQAEPPDGPCEAVLRRSDGRSLWVETYASKPHGGSEGVLLLTLLDITQRKTAEEDRQRLMAAIEQVPEAIIITDKDRRVLYANSAFQVLFGYDRKEALGRDVRSLLATSKSQLAYPHVNQALEQGQTWKGVVFNRTASGAEIEVETSVTPVKDEDGDLKYIVYVKRDVTEERRMERRLRHTQKLQAIGTLAGGIAHDFNNILMAILGSAQLAMMLCQKDEKLQRPLERIFQASQRASDMVRQILTFSRSEERPFENVSLKSVVQETMQLLRGSLPATIRMELDLDVDEDLVFGDATQLHQVIMNLCTNAAHAMRGRHGLLTVSLKEQDLCERFQAEALGVAPGKYLCLTVKDTGRGIPPDILDRIFEPFFTTKPSGQGSGLGLSVVHGIVRSHKGGIDVQSEPGKGTIFKVYLPKGAKVRKEHMKDTTTLPLAPKRILVVDDEEMVREVTSDLLRADDHDVTTVGCAKEALELLVSGKASPFDVIIVDQTMPHMTGLEFLRRLREYGIRVPAVLCSGNAQVVAPETRQSLGIHCILQKPFPADRLRAVLAELFGLESRSATTS